MKITEGFMRGLPQVLDFKVEVISKKEFRSRYPSENCDHIIKNDGEGTVEIIGTHIELGDYVESGVFSNKIFQYFSIDGLDTSNTKDMSYLFANSEFYDDIIDISKFNTSKVTNMCYMFYNTRNYKIEGLDKLDTHNVRDMQGMFKDYHSSLNIKEQLYNFDTSNVENMSNMFENVELNYADFSNFNTSKVIKMTKMFSCAVFDYINLSSFDTNRCEHFGGMFDGIDVEELHIENFEFKGVTEFRHYLSKYNRGTSIDERLYLRTFLADCSKSPISMFYGASIDNLYLGNDRLINNIELVYYSGFYAGLTARNVYIAGIDNKVDSDSFYLTKDILDDLPYNLSLSFRKITKQKLRSIVDRAITLGLEIKNEGDYVIIKFSEDNYRIISYKNIKLADTKLFNYHGVFSDKHFISLDLSGIDSSGTVNMNGLFRESKFSEVLDVSKLDTSNVKFMVDMFNEVTFKSGISGLDKLDTHNVISMSGMFSDANIDYLDIGKLDTSNVKDLSQMFKGCDIGSVIGIENLDLSSALNISRMFDGRYTGLNDLKEVDCNRFINWNISKVVSMHAMLGNRKLININALNKLDTSRVLDMSELFYRSLTDEDFKFNLSLKRAVNVKDIFFEFRVGSMEINSINYDANLYFEDVDSSNYISEYIYGVICEELVVNGRKISVMGH